ncbi:MAG: hypothetical protein UR93_C0010G0015 [Berkelbacteria bacterium GW2011_GWA2_35_9]|uniref:Uncharacterized protein n=1 Tax=Berkelbacteria bacterium GW2011_GWA2_35_9 TaxID=1618333 RepID=A0A0G0D3E0_9BACT|nr:MAG: hypothetical protein UR93_C0010G0015 [Berkelbacteria bacterium GW2011_GWA2_35_9]
MFLVWLEQSVLEVGTLKIGNKYILLVFFSIFISSTIFAQNWDNYEGRLHPDGKFHKDGRLHTKSPKSKHKAHKTKVGYKYRTKIIKQQLTQLDEINDLVKDEINKQITNGQLIRVDNNPKNKNYKSLIQIITGIILSLLSVSLLIYYIKIRSTTNNKTKILVICIGFILMVVSCSMLIPLIVH